MSAVGKFRKAIEAARDAWRGAPAKSAMEHKSGNFREAVGVTIDDDEDQWRRLTGHGNRDLSPMTHARMRQLAFYLWQTNLLANRLIELPVAYLLAEGVTVQVGDEEAQTWLDAFWNDPINKMDLKLTKKVRELALFGEQCWPAFVNEVNGHVRLGYLDPDLIETVVMDPDNAEQPIGIVTVKDKKGHARRYRVIVTGPEEIFSQRTQALRQTFADGECFYYRVNELSNSRRGYSDLLAGIDWADSYEQFLFGEMERASFQRAFIWDVTLKGATPEEVLKRAKEIAAPRPASIRVHNDSEEWQAVTPDVKGTEQDAFTRILRNHVLGSGTIPEHWFGGGGDVNLATASEMGEPTFKVFSMRQRLLKHVIEDVCKFVILRRLDASGKSGFEFLEDPKFVPKAIFAELTARDTSKYAAALQQVVVGSVMAMERGLLTKATSVTIIQAIAGRLGVEFDAEDELEKAQAERSVEREADIFREPPGDDAEGGDAAEGDAPAEG